MDEETMIGQISEKAIRLGGAGDLGALVAAAGNSDIVLLGEASHGTSEFYRWRTELSKRLIREKGFSFIAVEGDWPACYTLNRYIKQYPGAADSVRDAVGDFNRWPTWMWANREVMDLTEWLHEYNLQQGGESPKIGFYGLDVYSLWESMQAVVGHLEKTGAPELATAKKAFECFDPFSRDPQTYGVSAAFLSESCEDEVVRLLSELQSKRKRRKGEVEQALSDELNALVAVNAERYYRAMVRGGPESWNIRDTHMVEALNRIRTFYGSGAKAIVWEHNTHIGDARATDMAGEGMVNVGQLVREQLGRERVFAVGFGTNRGSVIAAKEWGGAMEQMTVPPAMDGSWENLMHRAGAFDKFLIYDRDSGEWGDTVGHRAIGVVYHPHREWGNYVPSRMAERYDAFVYIEETKALDPIRVEVLHV